MRISSILRILGVSIAVLAVFALIASWAVSVTTNIDISLWLIPAGFLVGGVIMMAAGSKLGR